MRVALTIDTELRGHPAREDNPARLLDLLADRQVLATFFLQGRWATAYPELARRVVEDGHLLGNHTHWHVPLPLLTDDGIVETVRRAERFLIEGTGADPRPWFRCPYGEGATDERVLQILSQLGYRNIHWDVDGEDWRDGRDVDDLVQTSVRGCLEFGDGARLLAHSWPDAAVKALPRVIDALRAAGAELVRLDELEHGAGVAHRGSAPNAERREHGDGESG